ncbi:MAG: ABC transporter ATP-binding protein [Chloroherpetonaceae bacterium]|nr:ABC transporter ATP-binding protein/permease [Chthonomonadaceae bacterium]MDW8209314.1 ABC transporter ATP-binding protein [Chloroherpetonaceae bacterium]
MCDTQVVPGREQAASEQTLIRLQADLDAEGRFGQRTLEVTGQHVRVVEPGGAISFQIALGDVHSARNEPLVGGGRLELTTHRGEILPVLSYSLAVAAQFSEAARGIEQLARGEPLCINLKPEQTRCARCQRLLPEKDGVCPACVQRGRTLLRVLSYMRPYRGQAILLSLLALVTTGVNLIPPRLQALIIDNVLIQRQNLSLLLVYMTIWLGVLVVATGVQIWTGRVISRLAGSIAADLRSSVYRAVEFLQVSYFDKRQVGAIASRVTQDTERVWGFLVDGLPYLASNTLLLVGIIIFLFRVSWQLALAVLSPVPIILAFSAVFWRPISQMYYRVGQKWARFHMHLNESLTGIRVVKAFAREDREYNKFLQRNRELRDAGIHADCRWFTVFGAMTLFVGMGALINWIVGGYMVYRGQISLGNFIMVNAYIGLVYGPLQWFGQLNQWFSRAMAGAERIFEVIDADKETRADQGVRRDIVGEVTFDNVRFGYDKSNPVLKGISFTARPGEMIGLVGKSGAGKSTTISLLCRFYEPDAGTIRIDGMDYREMHLHHMREQIGVVLQEPFLFNGTIAENIAYGRPGASFEEIVEAAKAANAHHFILSKPDGYDTIVGERGAKLSGGERQRISIARAILHNPRILILDEATSSVDVETEKQIQEAIARLVEGRTTFAIAHRLSTLRNATRLIVLDKGQIAEVGTHAELMEKRGIFFQLVETQSRLTQIIGIGEV